MIKWSINMFFSLVVLSMFQDYLFRWVLIFSKIILRNVKFLLHVQADL